MSHFSVAVFTHEEPSEEIINKALEPFYEGDGEDWLKKSNYFEFIDKTESFKEKYENQTSEFVICPDGTILSIYDERFSYEVPENEGYVRKEMLFCKAYPTFEEFMKDWENMQPDENGRYGYWTSKNPKWDWWLIGGRWSNSLKLKDGCKDYMEFDEERSVVKEGWMDSVRISCIDFEEMKRVNLNELPTLEEYIKKHYYPEEYIRKLYPTEQEFKERMSTFTTYAVITPDGEWIEKGQMGRFGFSSETEDESREWDYSYHKFLDMFSDCYITIVDCHI